MFSTIGILDFERSLKPKKPLLHEMGPIGRGKAMVCYSYNNNLLNLFTSLTNLAAYAKVVRIKNRQLGGLYRITVYAARTT
jgi:hypothetical protein